MPELETRLRELATELAWPDTPDLEAAVMAAPRAPAPRRRPRRLLAILTAALLLVPAAGAVAFPSARDDVLEWLGLRHVRIERVPAPPPPGARPELEADLGVRATRAEASRRAGFAPLLPSVLGAPDRVRVTERRISLIYAPRPGLPKLPRVDAGLILTEVRGGIRQAYLRKLVYGGTDVRRVDVAGRPAAFISGGSHGYLYEAPGGTIEEDRPLLAGPTLIWEQDGRLLRLETRAGQAAALRIARSVR